jgi:uncharacterized damage-inducible protein DinB
MLGWTPHGISCSEQCELKPNAILRIEVTRKPEQRPLEEPADSSTPMKGGNKMSGMTPEQAKFLLQDVYMGPLKNESRITKKVLEAVPADKADYRPDAASRSANDLVRHIAAADNRFLEAVINGVFDTNPSLLPESVKTPQEIASWYEQRFAKNFEALTKATGEQLVKIVDFRGMFQRPAVSFVMMGLHHTIHHRGQLSSYLRCMGAKVPSIYGESYDDAQARKAAGG